MTAPVQIAIVDDGDLAVAGLHALLSPYTDRVCMVDTRTALARPQDLDVILYEPMGQSSMAQALLRDLSRAADARAAVFSWVAPIDMPTPNPHLSKTLTASQLVVALEKLASERPETPDVVIDEETVTSAAEELAEVRPHPEAAPRVVETFGLTPRECDIVTRIVSGLSNREISEDLVLSVNSVKTYIRSAYRKMGVDRRTQAVLWGLEHGFGDIPGAALVS